MIDDGSCPSPQPAFAADRRRSAAAQIRNGNIGLPALWSYYYGIGGNVDQLVLDAYLHGLTELAPLQMDLIHAAIQEITADGPKGRRVPGR
jgi:hypothetical protein